MNADPLFSSLLKYIIIQGQRHFGNRTYLSYLNVLKRILRQKGPFRVICTTASTSRNWLGRVRLRNKWTDRTPYVHMTRRGTDISIKLGEPQGKQKHFGRERPHLRSTAGSKGQRPTSCLVKSHVHLHYRKTPSCNLFFPGVEDESASWISVGKEPPPLTIMKTILASFCVPSLRKSIMLENEESVRI